MGFQHDFGRFEARFPGVTLRIENERVLARVLAGLRGQPISPATVGPSNDPEARLEALCADTVFDHEARHFHDYLISPWAAAIFRQRVVAQLNSFHLLLVLHKRDVWKRATCLPVPLAAWCAKPESERTAVLARWNCRRKRPWVPPDLPLVDFAVPLVGDSIQEIPADSAAVDRIMRASARSYQVLAVSLALGSTAPPFLPMHLYEVSALLVQLACAEDRGGGDDEALLLQRLDSHPALCTALPIQLLLERIDPDVLSAATAWALFGAWPPRKQADSPSARFTRVAKRGANQGWPSAALSVTGMHRSWDRALGGTPVVAALRESVERDRRFLAQLSGWHAALRSSSVADYADEVARVATTFEMLARARERCVETYCDDPDRYVRPRAYLAEGRGKLEPPRVALEFPTSGFQPKVRWARANGFGVYGADGTGQRVLVLLAPAPQRGTLIAELNAAEMLTFQTVGDVLCSPLRLDISTLDKQLTAGALPRGVELLNVPRRARDSAVLQGSR